MSTTTKTSNPINDGVVENPNMSKSAKIRALTKAGFSRSQVALMLGIRYQHVRNVLLQQVKGKQG
jgi:hypothetical protein